MAFIFLAFGILLSIRADAHPVTYQGGTMIKSMFREDMSENSVTYSFHRQLAVGAGLDRLVLNGLDTSYGFAEFNALLKRWNGQHSQGNVYVLSGAGSMFRGTESELAGKAGLQWDFETRQFYTLAQYTRWFSKNTDSDYMVYRVGFAPFLSGYNELAVWCILQADYNKDMRKNVQLTPMLRFYYKNILWEFGSSVRGNFFGQFMVHL